MLQYIYNIYIYIDTFHRLGVWEHMHPSEVASPDEMETQVCNDMASLDLAEPKVREDTSHRRQADKDIESE